MKSTVFFLLACFALSRLSAQDCNAFLYVANSEVKMTTYDKKGGENGTLTYTISDVKTSAGTTTASFHSEMQNEKGKVLSTSAGTYKCSNGVLYVDAKAAMPGDQMSAYKDMEVKADQVFIDYPASLTDGQTLEDVHFKMEVYNKSALHSTILFDQVNRKVSGKESVSSPAGTWECFKITYEGKMKASIAPMNIGIPVNFQVTEWFCPGVGVVKTETRNKNGKIMGSTLVTSIKK